MNNEEIWDFDPDIYAEMWADRAPRGMVRCASCGEQWGVEEVSDCKCDESEDDED